MLKTEEVLGVTDNTAYTLMLNMNTKIIKIYISVTALYH
jgi:hypothetical protein